MNECIKLVLFKDIFEKIVGFFAIKVYFFK